MKEKGMRGAKMPGEHYEKSVGQLNPVCKEKYSGEFSNPSDLDRATGALASYVKKNRPKY